MTNIKNNSRLIIVQLLYSYYLNQEKLLFDFKNPYKRFIKKFLIPKVATYLFSTGIE